MEKIIIITGITSFLGKHTAKKFIEEGYKVLGIVHNQSQRIEPLYDIEGLSLVDINFDEISFEQLEYYQKIVTFLTGSDTVYYINEDDKVDKITDRILKLITFIRNYEVTFVHYAWAGTTKEDRWNEDIQKYNFEMSKKVLAFAKLLGASKFIFAGSQAEYSESPYGKNKKEFADFAISYIEEKQQYYIDKQDFLIALRASYKKEKKHKTKINKYYKAYKILSPDEQERLNLAVNKYQLLKRPKRASILLSDIYKYTEPVFKHVRMEFIHLRIFSVFGSEDRETSLISSLLESFRRNSSFAIGQCSQMWNFLYVEDYKKMLYSIITNVNKSEIYDIGSDDTRVLKDFVLDAYNTLDASNILAFGTVKQSREVFSLPDLRQFNNDIKGFKWTKFEVAIKEMWEDYVKNKNSKK